MAGKYDAINKIKATNPEITWTEAARRAGFSGEWTSYKGKAKPRTGNEAAQRQRRSQFDQTSTELASYKVKQLKQRTSKLSKEAQMLGLEPFQIEHLADQDDIKALISGSGGDPDNMLEVRQSDARLKDRVKQILKDDYAVTINPAEESIRAIPKRFYDPIADPSTLPGIDIKVEEYQDFDFSGGGARLKKFFKNVGRLSAAAAVVTAGEQVMAGEYGEAALTGLEQVPGIGDVIQSEPTAVGDMSAPMEAQKRIQRRQEVEQRAEEARKRGGRWKANIGGMDIAVPELGISEWLGIN